MTFYTPFESYFQCLSNDTTHVPTDTELTELYSKYCFFTRFYSNISATLLSNGTLLYIIRKPFSMPIQQYHSHARGQRNAGAMPKILYFSTFFPHIMIYHLWIWHVPGRITMPTCFDAFHYPTHRPAIFPVYPSLDAWAPFFFLLSPPSSIFMSHVV